MVQASDTIRAETRQAGAKGFARKLRHKGMVPAVAYGPGFEPRYLAVEAHAFRLARQGFGRTHIFTIDVEGDKPFKALVKEIQRHPVSRDLVHVDLYALDMARPIRVEVPIELVGKHAGAIEGGILSQVLRTIEAQCLPANIPEKLMLDVSAMNIGDSVHLSDIKLPEGVKLTSTRDEAVAIVIVPQEEEVAAPAAAAVEGEVPAEGGEAAAEGAAAAAPAEGAEAAADKGEKAEKPGKGEKAEKPEKDKKGRK